MDGPKTTGVATGRSNNPGQDGITDKWQIYSRTRSKWLDTTPKFAALASTTGNKIRLVEKQVN